MSILSAIPIEIFKKPADREEGFPGRRTNPDFDGLDDLADRQQIRGQPQPTRHQIEIPRGEDMTQTPAHIIKKEATLPGFRQMNIRHLPPPQES
jgi:hypothetical protein